MDRWMDGWIEIKANFEKKDFAESWGIFPCSSNEQHMHKLMNVKGQLRACNFGRQIRKRDSVVNVYGSYSLVWLIRYLLS
ncbi:hypothetical protein T11_18254 [Trichinella zimbabwensis]|uniref:Uncharacterized protein n=1 Tax=Trichinella zimbabwensis TaxID=268475 RepID=A0A0V1HPX6_9BILA|nr:hypothetical protein T11_18254 [Trichinella zimbabwensis]